MKYLMTLDELYAVAVANLGPMDAGSFAEFKRKASIQGAKFDIRNPKLVIDIKLQEVNDLGTREQPYPIIANEWDIFISDARAMAEYIPRVFVVARHV